MAGAVAVTGRGGTFLALLRVDSCAPRQISGTRSRRFPGDGIASHSQRLRNARIVAWANLEIPGSVVDVTTWM